MNMIELILSRHSYRGKYLPVSVPRNDLREIVEAGLAAPSGCNKQTTSLIAVDDPSVLEQLYAAIGRPYEGTAPAMICVVTQKIMAYADRTFYIQDYAAAIENLLLAIVAKGYQSCWYEGDITGEDSEKGSQMAKILGLPAGHMVVCYLPVGIAADEVKPRAKKPFAERAWLNGYQQEWK